MHKDNIILEGLRPLDLENTIEDLFEIDNHKSKMGEDRDVCVLTFKISDRNPAKDLMEFIEKGFDFVLDSDVSSGENSDGNYFVFVEIKRTPNLAEHIKEITLGVEKLTGIKNWKFKYHRSEDSYNLDEDHLRNIIPSTPIDYDRHINLLQVENYKKFFNKTLMDDLSLDNNILTFYKPFNKKLNFQIMSETDTTILENNKDPLQLDSNSMSEIFWLTKVLGNYNIQKIDNYFVFENQGRKIILQRIDK